MAEINSGRAARIGLAVLTFINLFNYLDRYVVASLVESLKKSELALSDTQAGSLMTGFVLVYMLTSPVFGALGDRKGRPRLLALGVGIWSAATALGGLARSFAGLFAARAAVGLGEAAYGTIAPALLADYFPKEKRGRVFAIFFAAIPIGSAAGYVLGGLVDQKFGWRAAFYVAGLPGLALALLCLWLKDPPRGAQDEKTGEGLLARGEGGVWRSYRRLLQNRPYRLTVLGYAAYTFALGGLAFWAPAFLERIRGMSKADATVQFGAIVVATGFVGTFAGGWAGDFFLKRSKNAYLWVSGWATVAAAPAALVAFASPSRPIYLSAIVVTELLLFASTGPINSAIVNVVAPTERATAVALSILGIHLLGDVPSPPLIGALSDATSLGTAFLLLPAVIALAGAIWLYAARAEPPLICPESLPSSG
jgi:MFS family permease